MQAYFQSESTLTLVPSTHYLGAGTQGPLLCAYQAGTEGAAGSLAFQGLSQVLEPETNDQLLASRYDSHARAHRWRDDEHRNHVGQVRARKVQREEEGAAASNLHQSKIALGQAGREYSAPSHVLATGRATAQESLLIPRPSAFSLLG